MIISQGLVLGFTGTRVAMKQEFEGQEQNLKRGRMPNITISGTRWGDWPHFYHIFVTLLIAKSPNRKFFGSGY